VRILLRWLLIVAANELLIDALRVPNLKNKAAVLIHNEHVKNSQVMFVLSGNPLDRGLHAAQLYKQGKAQRVVCTGGNLDGNMQAIGKDYYECELTKAMLLRNGVDSTAVELLTKGTSTYEEGEAIERYCIDRNIKSCIVVTSLFHTRRVGWVVEKRLEKAGIDACVSGAPPRFYDPTAWWKSEYGLLDLNNEYVKLVYYAFKYGI
jgi:uncharacterized SAM-binding protein YcdF (DUF218 family)